MKRSTRLSATIALAACFGVAGCDRPSEVKHASLTVPKVAKCGAKDKPETALQGQVPAALRANGFKGFNCNLEMLGQWEGEGGSVSSAVFQDRAGHVCGYFATAWIIDKDDKPVERKMPGVPVIDITDPTRPVHTASLTTPAMMSAHESLRVNPRRQVLAATFGGQGPEIDLYDLSGDCRYPQLIASAPVGTGADGGIVFPVSPLGHEGSFAPDGLTYYVGDITNKTYNAVDITNMAKPKAIAQFDTRKAPLAGEGRNGTAHGLSISDDGNRGYFVSMGKPTLAEVMDPNAKLSNGFYIVDTSEVQARKPNAEIKLISATSFKDGSTAQHTLPMTVAGKSYLAMVDEGGPAGLLTGDGSETRTACEAGMAPFPMARIYDISDERQPKLVSKLMLETHDIANCDKVLPDILGLVRFAYGSHYCTVDNRQNATAMACSYWNSGIRVFDIRDPAHPKEIAYYNPPGSMTAKPGTSRRMRNRLWKVGEPDECASRVDFDFARRTLTTMCADNGLIVLKFTNNVWPMPESTPAVEQTN